MYKTAPQNCERPHCHMSPVAVVTSPPAARMMMMPPSLPPSLPSTRARATPPPPPAQAGPSLAPRRKRAQMCRNERACVEGGPILQTSLRFAPIITRDRDSPTQSDCKRLIVIGRGESLSEGDRCGGEREGWSGVLGETRRERRGGKRLSS